jgi:hypothetical protein
MLTTTPSLSDTILAIQGEYERLEHSLGWRFLCVSKKVLAQNPRIVFLTLNPGGRSIPEGHPSASCEQGPAYLVEQWGTSRPGGHKLQHQIQCLFKTIGRHVPEGSRPLVSMESSLIGYFVPFRSPRFEDLHRRKESLDFGMQLWTAMLDAKSPRLYLAIDHRTAKAMASLCASKDGRLVSEETMPTGWGEYTASLKEYQFSDHSAMLLRLPHLSTFQLFSREPCIPLVDKILAKACQHL